MYPCNHSSPTPAAALFRECGRWLAFAVSLLLVAAVNGQALIAEPPPVPLADDPGRFEVRSASVELESGVYLLTARVDFRLSTEARDALRALIRRMREERRASYIFVNNRLEGNAPETIRAVTEE